MLSGADDTAIIAQLREKLVQLKGQFDQCGMKINRESDVIEQLNGA